MYVHRDPKQYCCSQERDLTGTLVIITVCKLNNSDKQPTYDVTRMPDDDVMVSYKCIVFTRTRNGLAFFCPTLQKYDAFGRGCVCQSTQS